MDEAAAALTHGFGLLLVLVAVPVLIVLAATRATVWHLFGVSIYGASLIALYAASTVYHSVQHPPAKRVLQILDHSAIYLLIAGTYTPFMLVNLRAAWGWTLSGLVWTIALVGVGWKIVHVERHAVISTIVYIAMGWLVVIAARPLFRAVPIGGLAWLLAGGLAYTLGVAFFSHRACDSTTPYGTCSCSRAAPAVTCRSCATSCPSAMREGPPAISFSKWDKWLEKGHYAEPHRETFRGETDYM